MKWPFNLSRAAKWMLAAIALTPLFAPAQTLTLTNGVQKYAALANTTVTLSGRCELWVTNSVAPLSGCVINLNSTEAWLFLPAVKPSSVVSSFLGQVRVSGAGAVADGNVRIVQYGAGAVVIPQTAAFQALQVFSSPHFTGASAQYLQYVYYTGAALGAMNQNIRSFKLKRGYMAVFAQNANGSGFSKCYVAQDGDLEVSVLPAALSGQVSFIYVTPWRWTAKKGIAGDPGIGLLNVQWWYNWNLNESSSRDLEYVAIRQTRYWPGLSANWRSLGVNTVLGYNEPDNASQANIAVGDAIWSWPDLLATGLRVGSPAVTDGGRSSWLYPFMQQADAAGLRVDFVAVHYYQCHNPSDPAGAASQMYNFLLDIWNHTHRPIWITEWNNGANWTTCGDPTYAQQQAAISAMINMLESTPFVERYALYNWVEDVRSVVTNNVLTAAGTTYRDKVSSLSYQQTLPDNGTRSLAQYLFETNTLDTSGYGNNALAAGSPAFTNGYRGQAVTLDGANNYLQLPPNLGNATNFSFAAWVNWRGGGNWQRLFDFGNDTSHYLFLTPSSGNGTLRFAINNGGGEQIVETGKLPANQWVHVCFTLSGGTGKIYTNGVLAATSSGFNLTPASFTPMFNYLGKSQFSADPLFNGLLDEVQIADFAFTPAQVTALQTDTPPQFTAATLNGGTAAQFQLFNASLAGAATDPDPGVLTYSKAAGPAWLTVNPNGVIFGTPGVDDGGTNYFTVRATDAAGASAFATLTIYVPATYGSGTWTNNADGNWDDAFNWSNGFIANGGKGVNSAADFSTLNITGDRTVTLATPRSIGTLKFGDTAGAQNWKLVSTGGALTLDTGSAASPAIIVNQNTATLVAPLAGTNGFTKSGSGTLVLGANSSLSGVVNIDTGSTTTAEGSVRVASPGALVAASSIQIRDNNSGSSTLQLDGGNGGIILPRKIFLSGRNSAVAAINNVAGTNTLSGGISVNVGGANYWLQSDAGLLNLGGTISSDATGARTFTFQGTGDLNVSGTIADGSGTVSVAKSGSGTLTLSGANTYTGGTTLNAGTLLVNGALGSGAVTAAGGTLGGSGTINGAVTVQPGATFAPGANAIGKLTINNSLTLAAGSSTRFEISKISAAANDMAAVNGVLTYGGNLLVTNLGGALAAGDNFPLFNAASSAGSFASTNLPALSPGLAWNWSNGVLSVTQTLAMNPTNIMFSVSGNSLTLAWPADHLGWRLEAQTNSLSVGLGTNWVTVADSTNRTQITLPLDATAAGVFFRLVYP
jgi:autotransporter-associated beta strand protein